MRKWKLWAAMAVMAVSLTACEAETKEVASEEKQNTEQNENSAEGDSEQEDSESDNVEADDDVTKYDLTVYYADENAEMQSKQVEIEELTSENIWNEIKSANPYLENVSVISCDVRQDEKKIDLNVSAELGAYLMSTGTSGETCAITAIVNTYLDAFGCDEIMILDNGNTLVSNHKEYNNYLKKR